MNLKEYLKMEAESNKRQHDIYVERNKVYATDDDVLENSKVASDVCNIWDIEPALRDIDTDWFRLVDKLTRERNCHRRDNLDDAMNYLRRIAAHYGGE